jgi:TetR/AcrR family transcriptional repressor of nem operon
MHKSAQRKVKTHNKILSSAEKLLRTKGVKATTVEKVMGGASLTVGGFYAHFDSKEALIGEALRRAFMESFQRIAKDTEALDDTERVIEIVKRYLSHYHRDHPEIGCPLPAVLSELKFSGKPAFQAVTTSLENLINNLDRDQTLSVNMDHRQYLLAIFSMCLGGIALARGLKGTGLSNEILEACFTLFLSTLEEKDK